MSDKEGFMISPPLMDIQAHASFYCTEIPSTFDQTVNSGCFGSDKWLEVVLSKVNYGFTGEGSSSVLTWGLRVGMSGQHWICNLRGKKVNLCPIHLEPTLAFLL